MKSDPFLWLHQDARDEVFIARVANRNLMLPGQQQDLLVLFELTQVSDILPINPNTRGSFHFAGSYKANLSQDFVLCVGNTSEKAASLRQTLK
jgi:hypothetical protein